MLGVSHATSGAALGLVVAGFLPRIAAVQPTAGSILTFAGACAGAALLPDLDHPSSAATRRFSVASWLARHAIRPLSEYVPGGTAGTAGWLGTAVTLGMLAHSAGDTITESGAPLLWPLRIRHRSWYPVGSPRPLRFRTGGTVEAWLVAPALTVAVFVLVALVVPGVAPILDALRDQVSSLLAGA